MTKIFIDLRPEFGCEGRVYRHATVDLVVKLDRKQSVSDSFSCLLYNSQNMLLDHVRTGDADTDRAGRSLKLPMKRLLVWLPGSYFLLLRSGKGRVLRWDMELQADGRFAVGDERECQPLSDEDVLSGNLCDCLPIWRRLSMMPGMGQVRRWAIDRAKVNALNALRDGFGVGKVPVCNNIALSCRSAERSGAVVMMLKRVAGFPGELKTGNCSAFFDPTQNNPYEELNSFFETDRPSESILDSLLHEGDSRYFSFHHLAALLGTGGKKMLQKLQSVWPSADTGAAFRGTQAEIDGLLDAFPSVAAAIPTANRLSEEPYSLEELVQEVFQQVHAANLYPSPGATDKLCQVLAQAHAAGSVSGWTRADIDHYVSHVLAPAYSRRVVGMIAEGLDSRLCLELKAADIDERQLIGSGSSAADVLSELGQMVGLDDIKQSITTLYNRMLFLRQRRSLGLPAGDQAVFHALFTGNPGTGKTTVARLLGKVYHRLGLLSKGDVVCVDRQKMVGRYIGETEENMKQILQEARGNVLFVDEAYTLYSSGDDKDFGRHALESLLDVLSSKNPDMLVVFAGYEKEMDAMLSLNPGLVGRFPYKFHFPDYSSEELLRIALNLLERDGYTATAEAREAMRHAICRMTSSHNPTFANARWVEQFVSNGIVTALADRLCSGPHAFTREVFQTVEAADVRKAEERFNPSTATLRRRNAIGFCA